MTTRAAAPLGWARALVVVTMLIASCAKKDKELAAEATGGDVAKGKAAIGKYGCGGCHTIPGIEGAKATVGPNLTGIGKRSYVAGQQNSLETLTQWVKHPQAQKPGTPMPEMGVTDDDAKHIAAYLYSLR